MYAYVRFSSCECVRRSVFVPSAVLFVSFLAQLASSSAVGVCVIFCSARVYPFLSLLARTLTLSLSNPPSRLFSTCRVDRRDRCTKPAAEFAVCVCVCLRLCVSRPWCDPPNYSETTENAATATAVVGVDIARSGRQFFLFSPVAVLRERRG